jgi:DNA-binding XRE family transcriptional regulator
MSSEVHLMSSPFVRRHRLANELKQLREERGYSSGRLAAAIGVSRQKISALENGHVPPDMDEIGLILDTLQVETKRRNKITVIAEDAAEFGWWERCADEIGPRQALYAGLEAGTLIICEYQMIFPPGLLQIPIFTEARARADQAAYATDFNPARALEARATRQRMLEQPGGPDYEVIIDELAVRRFAAPPFIVGAQLDHLVDVGHHQDKITIRVLPLAARIAGHAVPRSAFSVYRYPDPDDPVVVAVDTVTSDLLLTDAMQVNRYLTLYARLQDAALTPSDSLDFLARVAEDLHQEIEK